METISNWKSRKLWVTLLGGVSDIFLTGYAVKHPERADLVKWIAGFITAKVAVYVGAQSLVDSAKAK